MFSFLSGLTNLLPLLAVLSVPISVYGYLVYVNSYWKRHGVPFVRATPLLGSMTKVCLFSRNVAENFDELYSELPDEPIVGIHLFTKPALLIRNVDLVKEIVVKDYAFFQNRYSTSDIHTDLMGSANLFFAKYPSWKYIRNRISPFFTSGKMKQMYGAMCSVAEELDQLFGSFEMNAKTQQVCIEVNEIFARYSTDIIARTAFGVKANSLKDPNSEFRRHGREMFDFKWYRAIEFTSIFFLPQIVPLFGFKTFTKKNTTFLRESIGYVMDEREKSGVRSNDLIDTLIDLRAEDKHKIFTKDNIVFQGDVLPAQAASFLTAGFETSSSTLSFGLFELSQRPDIQEKLRTELRQAFIANKGELSYEVILNLEYLGMIISEVLRKYPPLPFLDRECTVPVQSNGYRLTKYSPFVIPKGMPVIIPIFSIHRDPKYWPDPERFDPERFSATNKPNIAPYSFIPFGLGPHVCVGERLGIMQVRLGFVHFFRNHRVAPSDKTPAKMRFNKKALLLSSEEGIHLQLIRDPLNV